MPNKIKRCPKCRKKKKITDFYKNNRQYDTYEGWCKICSSNKGCRRARFIKECVFNYYGNKCCWPECDITDLDMLSIDHILDNGASDRERIFGKAQRHAAGGNLMYRYLVINDFPKGYQPLCMNHQRKKQNMKLRGEKLPKEVTTI